MNPWYVGITELAIISVLILGIIICIICIIVRKHKKEKIRGYLTALLVNAALLACTVLFVLSHGSYYKYNDWLILGSDIDTVIEKYGEYDIGCIKQGNSGKIGYYIYTDNGPIMPDHLPHYYYIYYDENGIVYEVYDGTAPGG